MGRARQSDPPFSEFGIPRGCVRAARARDQRPRSLRCLSSRGHEIIMSVANPYRMIRAETYLDWNATTPLRPEAAAAISATLACCGNPSSVHRWGRRTRQTLEHAREAVAALLGPISPDGVVFVSGGTEANHLALFGTGREHVLVSDVEHDSVRHAFPGSEAIPVDRDGVVAVDVLDRRLATDRRPALVSVMFANNETGVIQPVAD